MKLCQTISDVGIVGLAPRSAEESQDRLQAVGVPAHRVQNSPGCVGDPQLAASGHFREVEHPLHGTTWVEGPRLALSRTPGNVTAAVPMVGQHTFEILSEILGYDTDAIADLAAAEVLE
jgi:crotonobetainyl-CoA:carnitine CoA-transferase CaiB-like acyl-CoA transferase